MSSNPRRGRDMAAGRGVGVSWVEANVTDWLASEPYALVVVAYLQLSRGELRRVWSHVAQALEPAGENFLVAHARRNLSEGVGGPQDPAVLWDPDEVADDLRAVGLQVSASEEVLRPVEGKGDAIDVRVRGRA